MCARAVQLNACVCVRVGACVRVWVHNYGCLVLVIVFCVYVCAPRHVLCVEMLYRAMQGSHLQLDEGRAHL